MDTSTSLVGHVRIEEHSAASSDDHEAAATSVATAGADKVLPRFDINNGPPIEVDIMVGTRASSSLLAGTDEVESLAPLPPPPAEQPQQKSGEEGSPSDGCEGATADDGKSGATGAPTPEKDSMDYELVACAVCCRTPQLSHQLSLSYCLKRTKNKTGVRHCPRLKIVPDKVMQGDASINLKDCQALLVPGQREIAAGEQKPVEEDDAVEVLRMTPANLVWR